MTNYLLSTYLISGLLVMWHVFETFEWDKLETAEMSIIIFCVFCPGINSIAAVSMTWIQLKYILGVIWLKTYWKFILRQYSKYQMKMMQNKGMEQFIKDEEAHLKLLSKAVKK